MTKTIGKEPVAYYHSPCMDGTMAAAIFLKRFPEAQVRPYAYGDDLGDLSDLSGHDVYLLDMTLDDDDLRRMVEHAGWVTVIDHHPKVREQVERRLFRSIGRLSFITDSEEHPASGAQLTWRFLHNPAPEPDIVRWIGKGDLWNFDEREIRPFRLGCGSIGLDPQIWKPLLLEDNDYVHDTLERGWILADAVDQQLDYLAERYGWTVIGGYPVVCANAPKFLSSELAERLYTNFSPEESPFVAIYAIERDQVIWSLRSRRDGGMNVNEVAQQYGGGGHPHAAGFRQTIGDLTL